MKLPKSYDELELNQYKGMFILVIAIDEVVNINNSNELTMGCISEMNSHADDLKKSNIEKLERLGHIRKDEEKIFINPTYYKYANKIKSAHRTLMEF